MFLVTKHIKYTFYYFVVFLSIQTLIQFKTRPRQSVPVPQFIRQRFLPSNLLTFEGYPQIIVNFFPKVKGTEQSVKTELNRRSGFVHPSWRVTENMTF